jgi:hypothetical protein
MPATSHGWTIRLRELFGARLDEVTEAQLNALIQGGVREDADLDYKRARYGSSDSEKRELAADLAAMANDRGGVIVIGLRDDGDVAVELTPVEQVEGEEGRLRQIVAGNTAPRVQFDVHLIESDQETGRAYYLLVVPPSPLRPHAVRKDNDLRYPRRDGSTKRWLSEAEVADLYRDRFRGIEDQLGRVQSVRAQGLLAMDLDEERVAYLAVALAPTTSGSMSISLAQVRRLEQWAVDTPGTYAWRGFFGSRPNARAGLRRVRLGRLTSGAGPRRRYAELHTDGAGFACERVGSPHQRLGAADEGAGLEIHNIDLIWETARSLRLLGRHAVENAGAWGDALVIARLFGRRMHLTYPAYGGMLFEAVNEQPLDEAIESHHTLPLDSLAGSDQDLLLSTRVVATDLFNAFGAEEVRQIDDQGRIRVSYFPRDERFSEFIAECGVEISDETVE